MLRLSVVFFMLLSFSSNRVCSQITKSISVGFTRTTTKAFSREVVEGHIYHQAQQKTTIKVIEPVTQWMVFEDKTMFIYYPNEHKAFRFTSENPFTLPFFQVFTGVVGGDLGLSEAGFTLFRNEMRGDTLVTYWKPPEQTKNILGNVITGLIEDRFVFVEVQDTGGKSLTKTTYHNYFKYGENFFPLEVVSVHHQEINVVVEKIVFSNPEFDVILPQEVIDFKIPANTDIKEIKW